MLNTIQKIWVYICNMKNYKYLFLLLPLVIGILLSVRTCKKPVVDNTSNGWKETEKLLQEQKRVEDSAYFDLKERNNKTIDSLYKVIYENDRKYIKQINDLNKKYAKEYIRVTNTPIDTTIDIGRRFLSKKINYSKFQK